MTQVRTGDREATVALSLSSSPQAVRAALEALRAELGPLGCGPGTAASLELVLAEVLNNICKHAYRARGDGRIEVSVWRDGASLLIATSDAGAPMPDGRLPAGRPPVITATIEDLPEGGFGWYMIRELTLDLAYDRVDGTNCLRFRMPMTDAPALDAD